MNRQQTDLTPELARVLLEKSSPRQRRSARPTVAAYRTVIEAGLWRLVDDPILVVGKSYASATDPEGSMFNGVHRCLAVIAAGRSIPVYIDWDADPSLFDVIDVGRRRVANQFVAGTYAAARAQAARIALWHSRRFDIAPTGPGLVFELHDVLREAEARSSAFETLLPFSFATHEYTGLSHGVVLGVYALAMEFGFLESIVSFAGGISAPFDLPANDPVRLVSERFLKVSHRGRRRGTREDYTILTRAFNLHLHGDRVGKLYLTELWPRVGETESFFKRRSAAQHSRTAYSEKKAATA